MTRINVILFTILICFSAYSQTISVSKFQLLASDLTANLSGTMEMDQNGEVAALIKVVTTQTGFSFDCGSMGVVRTLQKPSEVWVYVPHGIKKMTISHPQLGMLRDYYFNIPIEPARTYEMVLVSGEVQTIVRETTQSQYLVIQVTPSNAIVELNDEILTNSNGIAQKFVKLGTYDYRVQAPNYHPAAGKVTIDNPTEKKIISVNLQPAFGWIEIGDTPELKGAQVYIDNSLVGTAPLKTNSLPSGNHNIKIVKPLYLAYEESVTVLDNEVKTISPQLKANFSEVTLTVGNDADVYINNEHKGKGKWTGRLEAGTYVFETRKKGHRPSMMNVEIMVKNGNQKIQLNEPTPIYGEVNITSDPTMSEVYIDGKSYGQTPLYIPNLLVGTYEVKICHDGRTDYLSKMEVKEGEKCDVNAQLSTKREKNKLHPMNTHMVKFICNVPTASIYINGKYIGKKQCEEELATGEYIITANAGDDYLEYKHTILITRENRKRVLNIIMQKKEETTLEVKEGEYSDFNTQLPTKHEKDKLISMNTHLVKFICNVPTASIYINGNYIGKNEIEKELATGEYIITANAGDDYLEYKHTILITGENRKRVLNIIMQKREKQNKNR